MTITAQVMSISSGSSVTALQLANNSNKMVVDLTLLDTTVASKLARSFTGAIDGASGTAAAPTYVFTGDSDTGIFRSASDIIGFSTGGTGRLYLSSTTLTANVAFSGITGTFSGALIAASGAFVGAITAATATFSGIVTGPAGSITAPSYTFAGDPNTGIYNASADVIGFTTGGTLKFSISTTSLTSIIGYSGTTVTLSGLFSGVSATLSGTLTSASVKTTSANVSSYMEFGSQSGASTPYLDFHSGSTLVDYDSRIQASGGSAVTGGGTLTYTAATHAFNGLVTANTASVGTNTDKVATTKFVLNTLASSPALGGTPTVPTATTSANTTQAASLQFVNNVVTTNRPKATVADVRTAASNKYVTTDIVWSSAAYVTLVDSATITVDMSTFLNASVTLGGNRILGNPTSPKIGQSGIIKIIQDATGTRTLTFGSNYYAPKGRSLPVVNPTGAVKTYLVYTVLETDYIIIHDL